MPYDFNKLTKLPWWHWSHYVRPLVNWWRSWKEDRQIARKRHEEANRRSLVTILHSYDVYEMEGRYFYHLYKLYESPNHKRYCEVFSDQPLQARRDNMYRWSIESWLTHDFTNKDIIAVHQMQMAELRRKADLR